MKSSYNFKIKDKLRINVRNNNKLRKYLKKSKAVVGKR